MDSKEDTLPRTIEELEALQNSSKETNEALKNQINELFKKDPEKSGTAFNLWIKILKENPKKLSPFEQGAILLNFLGTEAISKLYRQLDDSTLRQLIAKMRKHKTASIEDVSDVLFSFNSVISESSSYVFTERTSNDTVLIDVIGEERARGVLGRLKIGDEDTLELVEILNSIDPRSLATRLVNEHPQTVTVIFSYLDSEKQAEVVKRLPEALQCEVALRYANLNYIDGWIVKKLVESLKKDISESAPSPQFTGGVQSVAKMLMVMDRNTEEAIMSRIEEKDPLLAEEVRKLMFLFEDLADLDDKMIQTILKEVPNDKLLLSLKTASDKVKDKIFKNISERAAEILKEDLKNMGPSRLTDVECSQQEIVNVVKRLEAEGKVLIPRGASEDAMV